MFICFWGISKTLTKYPGKYNVFIQDAHKIFLFKTQTVEIKDCINFEIWHVQSYEKSMSSACGTYFQLRDKNISGFLSVLQKSKKVLDVNADG